MRINVEDRALRDPAINRRLPRFAGLSRFDAFGRLIHVWGLAYDERSEVVLAEDIDDRAEHDGFAAAMVKSELADDLGDGRVRIRGVAERIAYLLKQAELGARGGNAKAARVANATNQPSERYSDGQSEPVAVAKPTLPATLWPTSGSGSGSALDLDLESAPAEPVAPAKAKRKRPAKVQQPAPLVDPEPSDADRAYAAARGVSVAAEWPAMFDHHRAKGKTSADWSASWRTWCGNAVRFAAARTNGRPVTGLAATAEILAERAAASAPFFDPFKPRGDQ